MVYTIRLQRKFVFGTKIQFPLHKVNLKCNISCASFLKKKQNYNLEKKYNTQNKEYFF